MCNRHRIFGGITFPNFVANACCNRCCEPGVVAQRVDSIADQTPNCCCCCCGCCGCNGSVAGTSNCSCGNVAGTASRPCRRPAVGGASGGNCRPADPIWGDIGGIGAGPRPPFFPGPGGDYHCRYPLLDTVAVE